MPFDSEKRSTTIIDIAKESGFSVSTVSRVIRGGADVNEKTRQHIQQIMEELGYRPSAIARALVSGEWNLIALLVSDLTNPFYPQLAQAVQQAAHEAGYTVVICSTDDDPETTKAHLTRLVGQGLNGVIDASVAGDAADVVNILGDARRIVFANRRPRSAGLSSVTSDNESGARVLTEYLLDNGHRVIGFIGGPAYATNALDRENGFTSALSQRSDASGVVAHGPFSRDTGYGTVMNWLNQGLPLSAIIGVNDTVALGALEALLNRGRRVPEDMSIAGFDNVDLASSSIFHLTTVAQDIEMMGRTAVELLISQLGSAGEFTPKTVILEPRLIERRTSGVVRGAATTAPGGTATTTPRDPA